MYGIFINLHIGTFLHADFEYAKINWGNWVRKKVIGDSILLFGYPFSKKISLIYKANAEKSWFFIHFAL